MNTLYQSRNHWNHYRIRSARAPWWDYGKNGVYFITICTKNKLPFFGSVQNGKMRLSELGQLVQKLWSDLPNRAREGVYLDAFMVMPNHIHAILVLKRRAGNEPLKDIVEQDTTVHPRSADPVKRSTFYQRISPKKGSLAHLIRQFKGLVTLQARKRGLLAKDQPLWQPRYYDRIVRNNAERNRLAIHIDEQPQQWKKDDYYCPTDPLEGKEDKHMSEEQSSSPHPTAENENQEQGTSAQAAALLFAGYQSRSFRIRADDSKDDTYVSDKPSLLFGQWMQHRGS